MDCRIHVNDSNLKYDSSTTFLDLQTDSSASEPLTWDVIHPPVTISSNRRANENNNITVLLPGRIKRSIPYVSIFIFTLTWVIFFYGIFFIIHWNQANLSLWSPISPPNESWFFFTINGKDGCSDSRNEVWRTVSYQFVHGGIAHIGLNIVVGCLYGCIFEIYHPFGKIAVGIIYQMSVILGALGHAVIWPYRGIYGCSAGVYGLIGGCWSLILFHKQNIDKIIYYSLLMTLIVQFIFDFLYYNFFYSDTVSYAGHAFGFYTGFCVGLAFGLFYVKEKWKKGIAVVGCCGLIIEIIYLYYNFYTNWPPVAYEQSFLHNNLKSNDECYTKLNN